MKLPVIASMAVAALVVFASCSGSAKKEKTAESDDIIVAAYIWPSCHDDSLAHKWLWREGIGEWEVIKQGNPRFPGHYQPRQPLWGYEMDDDPEVVEKWIQTALKYGVNTFVYDWYWYKDPDGYNGPYLEGALDNGFLGAPSNKKMHFYIMWANHDVKYNYWNYHIWGDKEERLFNPDVTWDDIKVITQRIITRYFKEENYLKIDGKPVLSIYSIDNLIRSFGSMAELRKVLDYMREETVKAGFKGLYIMENGGSFTDIAKGNRAKLQCDKQDSLSLDAFSFYNMGGFDTDYLVHGANAEAIRSQWTDSLDVPVYPCVSIAWDDTPRFPAKGANDVTLFHNTPTSFATLLQKAKEYVDAHPEQPRILTINAWNEWVEGSYLLPDKLNGYGYLQAVRDVLDGKYDTPVDKQD